MQDPTLSHNQSHAAQIVSQISQIRTQSPLVHNITNYVVMNNTANALLSIGASPVMAHAEEEVEDMVRIASALVINIGTLSPRWVDAMKRALHTASGLGKPVVLDPVGAGATPYRNQVLKELLETASPDIIRGNASEIVALYSAQEQTKGVDSTLSSDKAVEAARALCLSYGCVTVISGERDYVVSGDSVGVVEAGVPMMAKVTGMGCTASALLGAFAAVEADTAEAAFAGMMVMGVAGEMASEKAEGPGTFQSHFLDALWRIDEENLATRMNQSG